MITCRESFIFKFRNMLRITAGLKPVTVIRKKHTVQITVNPCIRRCIYALHLVIYHTVAGQFSYRVLQFIVPPLLKERIPLRHTQRMKYCIQVDVHKVQKILIIPAAHRIHGLIRKCKGVHKCLKGSLDHLHKRLAYRILF